ncbi:elongation of very long chain fatty acids protein-like [Ischnura elegans]|uniref:elongation of very long chain fatty acids protein-like n=1 Tax=Ischnura elegans TaxID=197161 RepID=UPI001ED89EC7|nr:elongation of very long chain fatty acids protein-like [Ischnura elegans]
MAAALIRSYRELMEKADDRVEDWFLMSSPLPLACIISIYIWFVKYAGPKWMENKEPYDLRWFLQFYNVFQVASLVWWYFFLKLTELTDTVTFALRKKKSHVSNLHVLHHSVMPMSAWAAAKFVPGGHTTFVGVLNTGVHVVMYSYYFLSTLGPEVQKQLFWKRHVTSLQMYHFLVIMLHSIQLLMRSDCNYPKPYASWIVFQSIMFYVLFNEFYKQQYGKTVGLNGALRKKVGVPFILTTRKIKSASPPSGEAQQVVEGLGSRALSLEKTPCLAIYGALGMEDQTIVKINPRTTNFSAVGREGDFLPLSCVSGKIDCPLCVVKTKTGRYLAER